MQFMQNTMLQNLQGFAKFIASSKWNVQLFWMHFLKIQNGGVEQNYKSTGCYKFCIE